MAEAVDVDKTRDEMINKFEEKQADLKDNADYYDAKRRPDAIGIAVPVKMQKLLAHVGYPRLYVNAVAERLELEGFRIGGKDEVDKDLWDWFVANDLDIESTLGHTDALVHGRSFVTISKPDPKIDLNVDPNIPIIRVEPPTALHAAINPRTRLVDKAIRAIYDEEGTQVVSSTLYLPDRTVIWDKIDGEWVIVSNFNHGLEMVPVVPLANRTLLSDLYGTSEITPELRSITDAAARILMLMQGTAELMGVPQRLLFGVKGSELGVDPDTGQSSFDAYIARILAFEDHEAKAQQFNAAELRNFVEALDALDRKAAAYTGLPPQYLSSASENPASADAIRAAETRLVKNAERKAKIFGGAWEQVMRIAYKVMKGGDVPPDMYRMETIWRDPSTPTYAAKADAAAKLYANGAGLIPRKRGWIDMGYTPAQIEENESWIEEENPMGLLGTMMGAPTPGAPKPTAAPAPAPAKAPVK